MATQAGLGAAPSARPTGTVTFLFSDIEGSTQHWERQRAAMPAVLRRHDELIDKAIEANGGHVFKKVGDAFCAAFWRAPDALAAAADAQRALAAEDWNTVGGLSVRMALHSGTTDEREGDYFGPTVNRVARLVAVAHGGQVVVSDATAALLRGTMPPQTELLDLGDHRLKDLTEPEHIWQLTAPGLVETFPPVRSLESLPNNLPRQLTPLVGREGVLAEVEPLVLERPLVSLVGTGGVGKTRVALQVGADLLDGSGEGVWFIDLAPLSDPALVAKTIASTFGLCEQGGTPMLELLLQYLRPRQLLLILDNCEHLIEEMARIADAILRTAPQVRLLATSREPLRIEGESVYRMPSLTVPPAGDSLTADQALAYGAIALFVQRAVASDSKFRLNDESAPIVAEICRRLDGIALAIELAAARVKVLPARQLAQKLDERFRVLTGGSRTVLPRQQTMRALIDWSYDLLSEPEQRLFRRVAIFAGGWTLEAAEAVCIDGTLDAFDVVDLLSSLVEKSLAVAEAAQNPRYRLLESTCAFAAEKLDQSNEREALARSHAQWAAALGDRAYEAKWHKGQTPEWYAEFEPELENARSAINWALSHDELVLAARVVVGFNTMYRTLSGGDAELRSWHEAIALRLDAFAHPELAALIWYALSWTGSATQKIETAQHAVELGERCGDPLVRTLSLSNLAHGLREAGRAQEAQPIIEGAIRVAKESGLTHTAINAYVLNAGGLIAMECDHFDEARQLYAEALALVRALGDETSRSGISVNMAELEYKMGNPARALELVSDADTKTRGPRTTRSVIIAQVNRAEYRIVLGDIAGARADAHDALRLARGVDALVATIAIQHLAAIATLKGDPRCGAVLRGYVDAWFSSKGCEGEATEQRTYQVLTVALRERLTETEIATLANEGAQLSEDQAATEALASGRS